MDLGNKIIEYREKLGMTQDALAQKLGVTNQAVSKWESNQCCPGRLRCEVRPRQRRSYRRLRCENEKVIKKLGAPIKSGCSQFCIQNSKI